MKKEMGSTLRELREETGYTVRYVIDKLKEHNIDISDKALYSYESNKRAISADTFLVLCEIYNCKNILETFSNIELDYSIPDDNEWKLIEKYRNLDTHGKDMVDMVLNKEYERSITLFNNSIQVLNAANQRTDIEVPEGTDTSDNDIMDDENF